MPNSRPLNRRNDHHGKESHCESVTVYITLGAAQAYFDDLRDGTAIEGKLSDPGRPEHRRSFKPLRTPGVYPMMKDEAQSGYKSLQDDVLKTLGLAMIVGQGVERMLSSCLTFPLHGEPLQTVEQLQLLLERHSKATLGRLLKALRELVDLHPTFDGKLDRFLLHRNIIAHRLHDVPGGFDLHSDEGRGRLKAFLLQYMEEGHSISMVFLGILREWASHEGIDISNEQHLSQRMQDHLDANVLPNLDALIRSKENK